MMTVSTALTSPDNDGLNACKLGWHRGEHTGGLQLSEVAHWPPAPATPPAPEAHQTATQ